MLLHNLKNYKLILGSASPRRAELLKSIYPKFEIEVRPVDEHVDEDLDPMEAVLAIAEQKMAAFAPAEDEIVITADTVVALEDNILGKPEDEDQAAAFLQMLSGEEHDVITAVCINVGGDQSIYAERTRVHFHELDTDEIDYYIDKFQPMDKAGAYGIQEWIGMIGIQAIEGDYFNVVGLPVQAVYRKLRAIEAL